jgi:hypothetical protein
MWVLVRVGVDICIQLSTVSSCLAVQVNNNMLSNELEERKRERENNNKFRGHCISLQQSRACTATLRPKWILCLEISSNPSLYSFFYTPCIFKICYLFIASLSIPPLAIVLREPICSLSKIRNSQQRSIVYLQHEDFIVFCGTVLTT